MLLFMQLKARRQFVLLLSQMTHASITGVNGLVPSLIPLVLRQIVPPKALGIWVA